jgi:GNAT superfamily N-acetyltransferase
LWINAEEPVHIGRKGTAEPYFFFRGAIDDVRIYNRVLDVDEVRALLEDGGYRTPGVRGVDPISGIWGSGAAGLLDLGFDGHHTVSGVVGSGSLNNPSAIKQGTFDSSTGVLKLEGEARRPDTGAVGQYVIDGRLVGRSLMVNYAFAGLQGQVTLTKVKPQSAWRKRLGVLGESLRSKIEPVLVSAFRFLRGRKRPSRAANIRLMQERGESAAALIVRDATREDIPALADLHVRTWNATYPGVRRPPTYEIRESQWREAFGTPDGSWFCFVIENAQRQLVGFAKGVRNPDGSGGLNKIYLLRDYQRLGLGRRLVGHLTRRFLAQGISSMYVSADAGNPSCGFYEALGAVNTVDRMGRKNLGAYVWRDLPGLAAKCPTGDFHR